MAVSDPIADMLTKIRNANLARHEKVDVKSSNLKLQIVKILKNEGFIKNFKLVSEENIPLIRIFLKYTDDDRPVLHGLERISTPGRRVYCGYKDMPSVYNGVGVVVVSSSNGVITGKAARAAKVGGELVCKIW